MSTRKFRVVGNKYGAELAIGKVEEDVMEKYRDNYDDGCDRFNAIQDDFSEEGLSAWELDDVEHINSYYADGGFYVMELKDDESEIPESGSDNVTPFEGHCLAGRERYAVEDPYSDEFSPVLVQVSNEKGHFGYWDIETDGEDFNPNKFAFTVIEGDFGEIVDEVWYDKKKLEINGDQACTDGKSLESFAGYILVENDTRKSIEECMEDFWEEYDANLSECE